MMKHEFEKMIGREVTPEQYKMIEGLYMSSDLDKQAFVKSIKPVVKSLEKENRNSGIYYMAIRDNSGFFKTPNGCWYHTVAVELVDVNIRTGKIKIRRVPNTYDQRYGFDFCESDQNIEIVA